MKDDEIISSYYKEKGQPAPHSKHSAEVPAAARYSNK
jgi:hypothetical protein